MRASGSSRVGAAEPHATSSTMSARTFVAVAVPKPRPTGKKISAAPRPSRRPVLWTAAMRLPRSCVAAVLLVLAVPRVAPAGDAPGAFAPYEDLLEVLADLT